MKQRTKWFMTALVAAAGLIIAGSAQAQYVSGDPTLDNVVGTGGTLTGVVGVGGVTITEPSGFGYGYGGWNIPVADQQVFNPADNEIIMTYTINSPTPGTTGPDYSNPAWTWGSFQPLLLDGNGNNVRYFGYDGYNLAYGFPNGQNIANQDPGYVYNPADHTVTITAPLNAATEAAIAAGKTITDITFSDDNETLPDGYSLTYNSIQLAVAPEPSTLALAGIGGIASLLAFRRRNK